jgi:hypothetical protein
MFKPILSTPQMHSEDRDEWRIDQALTETFPASDAIAFTPARLFRESPKAAEGLNADDCNFDDDTECKSLETAIECVHCHTKIPATVALNFEGTDYVHQFCGPQCVYAWYVTANVSEK